MTTLFNAFWNTEILEENERKKKENTKTGGKNNHGTVNYLQPLKPAASFEEYLP